MDYEDRTPAFVFEGELDPSLGEPVDGFSYLKTVRWEANRLPQFFSSEKNVSKSTAESTQLTVPQSPPRSVTPPERIPPESWTTNLLERIYPIRERYLLERRKHELGINRMEQPFKHPAMKDRTGWIKFCVGDLSCGSVGHEPLISLLICLDELTVIHILSHLINWTKLNEPSVQALLWTFSLLICLDLPILAHTQAELREFWIWCHDARATSNMLPEDVTSALNCNMTLLASLFKQGDPISNNS